MKKYFIILLFASLIASEAFGMLDTTDSGYEADYENNIRKEQDQSPNCLSPKFSNGINLSFNNTQVLQQYIATEIEYEEKCRQQKFAKDGSYFHLYITLLECNCKKAAQLLKALKLSQNLTFCKKQCDDTSLKTANEITAELKPLAKQLEKLYEQLNT